MTNNNNTSAVRVGVRVRPLTSQEISQGGDSILKVRPPELALGERRFTYDAVFDSHIHQAELYESVSKPLLSSFLEGYNATIMAYGQTGSGKTFTMGSEAHTELELSDHTGLIPRFMNEFFIKLKQKKEESDSDSSQATVLLEYHLQASFLEVYGEDVHDLLDSQRQSLPLREDSNGGIVCAGLTHRAVHTAAEALNVLHEGTLNRTTAATLMNLTSSRSHAVFTVTLTQVYRNDGVDVTAESRFTFVDLAGSERMKKTGAEGERAREGIKINEGLLALGNVINALADEERNGKRVHVPYRQSKLTRLLQDALGGNSQTLFLACVSPSDTNASETLSTLHYANRARNIKNAPIQNVDASIVELQRYKAIAQILQVELVKAKFACDEQSTIGEIDENVMKRNDVNEYLDQILTSAREKIELKVPLLPSTAHMTLNGSTNQLSSPHTSSKTSLVMHDGTPNKSILENFDIAMLDEVNPDEEMAILNQLLELQHHDHEFDKVQKEGSARLREVEGELAEQEAMLLQLRDSLRVYHSMKIKYESLMAEVQQLEMEKAELANQLEMANNDPSQGNSKAIKKELEKVEKSLARARNETRKHREMYRKVEQEAQKCRVLERKVTDLKQSRANLMKQQKEAAVRHREYTEAKTREISCLKRKERNNEMRMSKLQTELHMHKRNLEKRQVYINKLTTKLNQTESHLMKLLAMRNRELQNRTNLPGYRRNTLAPRAADHEHREEEPFAPQSDELKTIIFLLDKCVSEEIGRVELQQQYEERVNDYSEKMRLLVDNVNQLEAAKRSEDSDVIQDIEQSIEELELKIELVGSDLESIRAQMSEGENLDPTVSTGKLLQDKSAPLLRSVLLEVVGKFIESELNVKRLDISVKRKETAMQSFENEIENLNNRIISLTKEIDQRQSRQSSSLEQLHRLDELETENVFLLKKVDQAGKDVSRLQQETLLLSEKLRKAEQVGAEACERLAIMEVSLKQSEGVNIPEHLLTKMQDLWRELGIDATTRNEHRRQIENCLEDTCTRKLEEASSLKEETQSEINRLTKEIARMENFLGLQSELLVDESMSLLIILDTLRERAGQLEPTFKNAVIKRDYIAKLVEDLCTALGAPVDSLDTVLQMLLKVDISAQQTPSHGSLSNDFLDKCERATSALRLKKTEVLIHNSNLQKEAFSLIEEMNVTDMEILSIIKHSVQQRDGDIPSWWSDTIAESVMRVIMIDGGVIRVSTSFSQHLKLFHESLSSIATSRRELSNKLRDIVERAQKTLLQTVQGEVDAIDAYSSFHDALFRLPALSKERVNACINEINALIIGVDTMTQSEIEALTVVWEALDIQASQRGKFWEDIDKGIRSIETKSSGPFDDVLSSCSRDGEAWVLSVVKDATKDYRTLESRLFKLECIHNEVEQLRSKQDAKSKIFSLDSEIRILNAKLSEFEEQKCNKERLLTKKTGSAALLKEERFRKQMQSKFIAKLEQLAAYLKSWLTSEGSDFDVGLLSDEVRMLLQNSDKMETWVEKRTEFMHLRTVKSKATPKRSTDAISRECGETPLRKRQTRNITDSVTQSKGSASKRKRSDDSDDLSKPPKLPRAAVSSSRSRSVSAAPTATSTCQNDKENGVSPFNPQSSKSIQKTASSSRKKGKTSQRPKVSTKTESISSSASGSTKRLTLPPFGHVLEQAMTPGKGRTS